MKNICSPSSHFLPKHVETNVYEIKPFANQWNVEYLAFKKLKQLCINKVAMLLKRDILIPRNLVQDSQYKGYYIFQGHIASILKQIGSTLLHMYVAWLTKAH
jgi:hypothetical protein